MDSKKDNEGNLKKFRIVEIIGPAGAGKTTLCNELSRYREHIRLSNFPDVRKVANFPFFFTYGARLIPPLINISAGSGRRLNRREFAWLTILSGWPTVLQKELKKNDSVIILDQGPVYLLSDISEFGPESLRRKKAKKLWRGLYSRWADMLDMIVWLDTADTDLIKRIRSRDKEHVGKYEPIETTLEFLACYRNAYDRTISSLLVDCPGLKILRFDTNQKSPEEIAWRLLLEFGSTK
jgi:deoxyadenosine/deoxycytidine kinase